MKRTSVGPLFLSILLVWVSTGCDFMKDEEKKKPVTTELEGTWNSALCDYSQPEDTSYSKSFKFSGSSATMSEDGRSGSGCSGSIVKVMKTYYTFSLGDAVTVPTGAAKKIDLSLVKTTYTSMTSAEVSQFNSQAMCGISTWVVNVETDITGKTCDGQALDPAGTKHYDIYGITGSNMFLGDDQGSVYPGTTDANRPVSLNASDPFAKQ